MKAFIIVLNFLFITQVAYGQNCTPEIPHEFCSWESNACYYKKMIPKYKNEKIVDVEDFLFLVVCLSDFKLDTIAPNFVKDLPQIEVLKLPLVSQFPRNMEGLKALKKLVQYPYHPVSSNQFLYTELPEIPAALWKLKSLEELSLYTAQLTEDVQGLSALRSLELHIEDRLTETVLPEAITWQKLKKLETVWLYSNFLNEGDVHSLTGFKNLRSLSLLTNNTQDDFVYVCLEALKDNSQAIEELILTTNTYRYQRFYVDNPNYKWKTISTKEWIPKKVDNVLETTAFPKITKLILSDCSIKEFTFKNHLFPQLQTLNLSLNRLEKLEVIVDGMSSLKRLDLSYNYLTTLPKGLTKLTNLEELDLRGNRLLHLPVGIEDLPNLKKVILDNQMSPKMLAFLKQCLGKRLFVVNISSFRNKDWSSDYFFEIEDRLKRDFSNQKWENTLESKNIKLIESIYLTKNELAEIPPQIFACKNLKYLDLSRNELKGKLSRRVVQLKELECLNLAANYLNKLPCAIGKMKHLKRLDLSSNCLPELPKTIAELKALEYLSISYNPIKVLPEELKNLKKIKEIHISRDLPDALKKQLVEWFGKEKIVLVVDEPYFLDEPYYIKRINAF